MDAVLVMIRNDGEKRSFSLSRETTVIGRRQDCDLMIPLAEISRKHCRFIKEGDTIRLEDLGSSNGTHCNGRRIQESVLSPGDTVQVGPVTFVLQIDGVPAEDEITLPAAAPGEVAEQEPAVVEGEHTEGGESAYEDVAIPTPHEEPHAHEQIAEPGHPPSEDELERLLADSSVPAEPVDILEDSALHDQEIDDRGEVDLESDSDKR